MIRSASILIALCGFPLATNAVASEKIYWNPEVNEDYCYVRFERWGSPDGEPGRATELIYFGVQRATASSAAKSELNPLSPEPGAMIIWTQILPSFLIPEKDVEISKVEVVTRDDIYALVRLDSPDASDELPVYALVDGAASIWADIVAGEDVSYRYLLNPSTPIHVPLVRTNTIDAIDAMLSACYQESTK